MPKAAEEKAARHLSQIRYHRHFTLPANPDHGRPEPMRVTYADCDYRNYGPEGETDGPNLDEFEGGPTIFLIGGMFGTRYMAAGNVSALTRKHRCRLISADKFSLGGTGSVPLEYRVKSFVDLIDALLDHLNVKHVTMVSHSAGTIYILNAVLQLRDRLHPKNPFLCLFSPWVHPSRSGEMKTLNLVPDAVLGQWDKIITFINGNITPSIQWSGGLVSSITNLGSSKKQKGTCNDDEVEEDYDKATDYGTAEELGASYWNTAMSYVFAENAKGGNEETFLCLKRGTRCSWGYFEDFDEAVPKVFAAEAERNPIAANETTDTAAPGPDAPPTSAEQGGRLRVKIFFADSDFFIGKKGREWMEGLWRQPRSPKGSVIYESTVVEGSDHDSIFESKFGVVDQVFAEVRRFWVE